MMDFGVLPPQINSGRIYGDFGVPLRRSERATREHVGGVSMLAQAARGSGTPAGSMPRFDIRPTVVARPVAAG